MDLLKIIDSQTVEVASGKWMVGARFWMGADIAEYINGLDTGFCLIDNGGGIRTMGYDRELGEDAAMTVGIWSNEDGYEDGAPSSLTDQAQVVMQCYDHMKDIWIVDTLHTGTTLECINWLAAEEPNRMNDAEAKYMPQFKAALETGNSRNMSLGG